MARILFAFSGAWMMLVPLVLAAAEPVKSKGLTDVELDRLAVDVLKDVHNRGAELYNSADASGALAMYEGALRTVVVFLPHHPKLQKSIADALAEVEKTSGTKVKAFRLHELIESTRDELKASLKASAAKQDVKPGKLSGIVSLDGEPLKSVSVSIVSLDLPQPRVFHAQSTVEGKYAFEESLPPSTYAVMFGDEPGVPKRYQSTLTSGLSVVVAPGEQSFELKLSSK